MAKLANPELYLSRLSGQLVILDEIQHLPELFPVLRSLVDQRRRDGERTGQFLLPGSASPELLQQSAETLAGRISYLELPPLHLTELDRPEAVFERHWFRGGYPDAYLAASDLAAMQWGDDFLTSYVERYLPPLGVAASHYRTHAGAEVDLVLEDSGGRVHAIEIKRTLSPKLTPAFRESMTTLGADRGTYLMPGGERFPMSEHVTAINLIDFLSEMDTR